MLPGRRGLTFRRARMASAVAALWAVLWLSCGPILPGLAPGFLVSGQSIQWRDFERDDLDVVEQAIAAFELGDVGVSLAGHFVHSVLKCLSIAFPL